MKICYTCKIEKEDYLFHKRKPDKLHSNCIDCHKNYVNNHYKKNKDKYILKSKVSREKANEFYVKYKENLFCTDCNISFLGKSYLCDFHHTENDKEISPALLVESRKRFLIEVSKCIPLCANCHRIRHHSK